MNTKLLREDELYKPWPSESGLKDWIYLADLLRQRLIEEREDVASLRRTFEIYSRGCAERMDELENELAEARRDSKRLAWLASEYHFTNSAIDDAIAKGPVQ